VPTGSGRNAKRFADHSRADEMSCQLYCYPEKGSMGARAPKAGDDNPVSHHRRRLRVFQFFPNGSGQNHFSEQRRKDFDVSD
jgi:hypothetical protein